MYKLSAWGNTIVGATPSTSRANMPVGYTLDHAHSIVVIFGI